MNDARRRFEEALAQTDDAPARLADDPELATLLAQDPSLARALARLNEVDAALAELPLPDMSEATAARILASTQAEAEAASHRRRRLSGQSMALAACVTFFPLLGLAMLVWLMLEPSAPRLDAALRPARIALTHPGLVHAATAPTPAFTATSAAAATQLPLLVDVGSLARVRLALAGGQLPSRDEYATAELVNALAYDDPLPRDGEALAVHLEAAPCPWAPTHRLMRLALRTPRAAPDAATVAILHDARLVFNPRRLTAYRLVGLSDTVGRSLDDSREKGRGELLDGIELPAGYTLTLLYEVVPAGEPAPFAADPFGVRARSGDDPALGELATVSLLYRVPPEVAVRRIEAHLEKGAADLRQASANFKLAAAAALFGLGLEAVAGPEATARGAAAPSGAVPAAPAGAWLLAQAETLTGEVARPGREPTAGSPEELQELIATAVHLAKGRRGG